jgi:8-oxo-dGTP diphosphatase
MKTIEVVAAIIFCNKKILCVQRNEGKYEYVSLKWEFPGGKVEPSETFEQAITREIKEELVTDIKVEKHFLTVNHQYPDFFLTMHSFICSVADQDITLTEHIDYKWLEPKELARLDWAAADIPIVEQLKG